MHTLFANCSLKSPERQIRLLTSDLTAGFDDGLPCYTLKVHDCFDAWPEYTAISYTWGPSAPSLRLRINGHIFEVGMHCWYALWQVRHYYGVSSPAIWIDSICINQGDDREKTLQVALMGKIYSNASCVAACIGSSDVLSRLESSLKKDVQSKSDVVLQELDSLTYFSRLWITQELVLASKILLLSGLDTLSWDTISAALKNTAGSGSRAQNAAAEYRSGQSARLASLCRSRAARVRGESPPANSPGSSTLLSLLTVYRQLRCTDPRDKVYALLSLLPTEDPARLIVPNYNIKTLQLFRIIHDFCWKHSKGQDRLNVLRGLQDVAEAMTLQGLEINPNEIYAEMVNSHVQGAEDQHAGVMHRLQLLYTFTLSHGEYGPCEDLTNEVRMEATARMYFPSFKEEAFLRQKLQQLMPAALAADTTFKIVRFQPKDGIMDRCPPLLLVPATARPGDVIACATWGEPIQYPSLLKQSNLVSCCFPILRRKKHEHTLTLLGWAVVLMHEYGKAWNLSIPKDLDQCMGFWLNHIMSIPLGDHRIIILDSGSVLLHLSMPDTFAFALLSREGTLALRYILPSSSSYVNHPAVVDGANRLNENASDPFGMHLWSEIVVSQQYLDLVYSSLCQSAMAAIETTPNQASFAVQLQCYLLEEPKAMHPAIPLWLCFFYYFLACHVLNIDPEDVSSDQAHALKNIAPEKLDVMLYALTNTLGILEEDRKWLRFAVQVQVRAGLNMRKLATFLEFDLKYAWICDLVSSKMAMWALNIRKIADFDWDKLPCYDRDKLQGPSNEQVQSRWDFPEEWSLSFRDAEVASKSLQTRESVIKDELLVVCYKALATCLVANQADEE
ncbi:uncharacterized protein PV09_01215 [Verruconis gallopava]|uniref:Heterokaryon incompatibility domain-containing protein n=1 Tax=Verruconis gallopava TaxID=253628 RepID=A0A0D1Z5Q1_9PEZI|nr:uncharacterized protein PV09_01215 [Verruconis gallopava]KIW08297.1 hypothetical protein PV09_01215 [Verruconis gallopava]